MAANHFLFKLTFLSFVLLPIVVSAAFPLERTKTLNKIRAVNAEAPCYGLITSSRTVEKEFFDTADFVPNQNVPYVDLAGRRFRIGVLEGKNVIFVRSGGGLVNAVVTTQLLLDYFNAYGVVTFGVAGRTNNSMEIGDVVVPKEFVNTGVWDWMNTNADIIPSDVVARLEIADYNVPRQGSNLLGRIAFRPEEFYSERDQNGVRKLWFQVNDFYLSLVPDLQEGNVQLPNIVTGVRGSSSNIYVNNAAYREFLYKTFQVSSVDMESSAIVMTCLSNGNPRVIAFRGLSNTAGGGLLNTAGAQDNCKINDQLCSATRRTQQSNIAYKNVARVVARFIKVLPIILQHAQA